MVLLQNVATIVLFSTIHLFSAIRFFTNTDKLCVSKCSISDEKYYFCYTGGDADSWDYCSPRANVDVYNRPCQNPCGKYGENYYWCEIEWDGYTTWEYCGIHRDNFQMVASNGYFCLDECAKGSSGDYWCDTEEGWDYCSLDERSDHYSRPCAKDSFCGKHEGSKYYWCHIDRKKNESGYCSIHSESKHLTHRGYYCSTECLYNPASDYFQCRIFDGSWQYCSPLKETDSRGHVCTYTRCTKPVGKSYYWCYYDNGKWDYCGLLSLDGGCSEYFPDIGSLSAQINLGKDDDFLLSQKNDCIKKVLYEGDNEVSEIVLVNSKKIRAKTRKKDNASSESIVLDELHSKVAKSLIQQLKSFKLSKYAQTVAREGHMVIKVKGYYKRRGRYLNVKLEFRRPKASYILDVVAESSVQVHHRGRALFPLRYIHQCLLASLIDEEGRQCYITHTGYQGSA